MSIVAYGIPACGGVLRATMRWLPRCDVEMVRLFPRFDVHWAWKMQILFRQDVGDALRVIILNT